MLPKEGCHGVARRAAQVSIDADRVLMSIELIQENLVILVNSLRLLQFELSQVSMRNEEVDCGFD